jgi:hypothetical protein
VDLGTFTSNTAGFCIQCPSLPTDQALKHFSGVAPLRIFHLVMCDDDFCRITCNWQEVFIIYGRLPLSSSSIKVWWWAGDAEGSPVNQSRCCWKPRPPLGYVSLQRPSASAGCGGMDGPPSCGPSSPRPSTPTLPACHTAKRAHRLVIAISLNRL